MIEPTAYACMSAIIRALKPHLTATIAEGDRVAEIWLNDECIIRCDTGSPAKRGETTVICVSDGVSQEQIACRIIPRKSMTR
jgi:hypothetical protein